jgi:hypothetical protein
MVRLVYYRVKKILLVNMKDTCININFIEQDSRFILCFTILGLLDIEQLEYLKQYGTCILFYSIVWQNNQLSLRIIDIILLGILSQELTLYLISYTYLIDIILMQNIIIIIYILL